MTYTEQLRKREERNAEAQLAQANADAWREVLRTYDAVLDTEANFKLTLEFCEGQITAEKFRFLFTERPEGYDLALAARIKGVVTDDRPKLIEAIMEVVDPKGRRFEESLQSKFNRAASARVCSLSLYHESGGALHAHNFNQAGKCACGQQRSDGIVIDANDYALEETRKTALNYQAGLKYLSRVQLMDELTAKTTNSDLRSMTVDEVRKRQEAMRGPRQDPPRNDGFPRMPRHLVLSGLGHIQMTELTPAVLRELRRGKYGSAEYNEWKRLVHIFGATQVDERSQ